MAYEYYCTSCGNRLKPGEVVFGLGLALGLRTKAAGEDGKGNENTAAGNMRFDIYITPEDIKKLLNRTGSEGKNHERTTVWIWGEDMLEYILRGKNVSKDTRVRIEEEFKQGNRDKAIELIAELIAGQYVQQNKENKTRFEESLKNDLEQLFTDRGMEAEGSVKLVIEVEYLDNGDIYTFSYEMDEECANLKFQEWDGVQIRGLCPHCHKPLVNNAGKYRHIPVGFLGKKSAGKTSLLVALAEYMKMEYAVLTDEKSRELKFCCDAYDKGWAPPKTLVETKERSFNVTLFSERYEEKCLITLVDIAGELFCRGDDEFDARALQMYPLVSACKAYVLCACITKSGYRNAEDDHTENVRELSNKGLVNVLDGIYANRRDKISVPPLAILLTKLDMAEGKASGNDEIREKKQFGKLFFKRECRYFDNADHLRQLYFSGDQEVVDSLNWLASVYEQYWNKTYETLLWCSPLGRSAASWPGTMNDRLVPNMEDGEQVKFIPKNLECLVDWITGTIGLTSPEGSRKGNVFNDVPSFNESYWREEQEQKAEKDIKKSYPLKDAEERIRLVEKQFFNMSELDKQMLAIYQSCRTDVELNAVKRLYNITTRNRKINSLLEKFERGERGKVD